MKKLVSLLLALVMVFSFATVAFAAQEQDTAASFSKKYVVTNGTAPAETFNFNVEFESYKNNEGMDDTSVTKDNAPVVTLGTAAFEALSATSSANVSVTIGEVTNAPLGVYTYKITESAGNTAGVTYNGNPVYLVLTVLRDEQSQKHYVAAIHYEAVSGDKTGEIVNSYNAGNLTVTKEITGNMADMSKEFTFTITLNAADGKVFDQSVQNAIAETGAQAESVIYSDDKTSVTITVKLGDGESINITNIPVGTTYTVSENSEGYTSTHTGSADGSIAGGDNDQDTWTNDKSSTVDTGIALDSMPFVLILAVAAIGCVALLTKKRREF